MNKEKLEQMKEDYWKNNMSMKQLGEKYGMSQTGITYHFQKNGIKSRNRSQAIHLAYNKQDFEPNKTDERYWLGLAWVLETDGYIGFQSYKKKMPQIGMAMKSKKFILHMVQCFPELWKRWETKINTPKKWNGEDNHKAYVLYQIRNNNMQTISDVLKQTTPHMSGKKYQAILLKEFCDSRLQHQGKPITKKEQMIMNCIKALNTKNQDDDDKEKIYQEFLKGSKKEDNK